MYDTRAGRGGAQSSTDTSARVRLRSCPDGPLGDFLRDITPPGAPALRLALDDPPCPLPLTAPWLATRQRHEKAAAENSDVSRLRHIYQARQGEDWALEAVDAIFEPTKPELRRALATWIATDARTAEGLPTLSPSPVSDALTLRLLLRHPRGALFPALQLAAAVRIDIHERLPFEPDLRILTERLEGRDATTARRHRRLATPGRRQYAELGVWPWTHAHDGVLPPDWRNDPAFIEPLNEWWQRSHTAAATAVLTHKRAWERYVAGGQQMGNTPPRNSRNRTARGWAQDRLPEPDTVPAAKLRNARP